MIQTSEGRLAISVPPDQDGLIVRSTLTGVLIKGPSPEQRTQADTAFVMGTGPYTISPAWLAMRRR